MEKWQQVITFFYLIINCYLSIKGFYESHKKKNAYGLTTYLSPLGIFVWGDAVIFGAFWFLVSVTILLLNDWILFLLIISVFWLVRSLGETIYWFCQQFTSTKRNPPKSLPFYKYFHNDSIWFIYQIFMQCITVVTIITTIYLIHLWLN